MLETPDDLAHLQQLLDRSAAGAGSHLRGIITDERRLTAERVCQILQGMRLLVVATVTAGGRPLAGPVDGYFLHGSLPRQGPEFETWLEEVDAIGARIVAEKMFTFSQDGGQTEGRS
jgi:hypothetical protein